MGVLKYISDKLYSNDIPVGKLPVSVIIPTTVAGSNMVATYMPSELLVVLVKLAIDIPMPIAMKAVR